MKPSTINGKIALTILALTLIGIVLVLVPESYISSSLAGAIMALCGLGLAGWSRRWMTPLREVTDYVEAMSQGKVARRPLRVEQAGEVERLATAVNRLNTQLRGVAEEADELARGMIGIQTLADRVLDSGDLSAVDFEVRGAEGGLNHSFTMLTNQLRRVAVMSHIIASDNLQNPALDDELPGELGETYGAMIRHLRQLASNARRVSHGDLTVELEGGGDLGSSFNEMVNGLRELVGEIVQSALQISSASEEMLQVLREQQKSARDQARRIEATKRSMDELLDSADAIARSARTVSGAAEKTRDKNRQIGRRITTLEQQSDRIREILELIRNIADRSDLLALNASLEGQRAGEAGQGFTLVAQEMRRLAENTKESVGNVKNLVSEIGETATGASKASKEGLQLSEKTTKESQEINEVSRRQREATEDVGEAMEELTTLVNHGVAGIRQVTHAASDLADLADRLGDLVDRFEVRAQNELGHGLGPEDGDGTRTFH
ncbi:MAG: methyl-accepting chemotaxis protein [Myxococcota bacterium]